MRHAIWMLALIGCGCATTPPADDFSSLYDGRPTTAFVTEFPAGSAPEAIARGDHAYASGELDRALYLYLQAIEADPARPEAFLRVGVIHEQRGKPILAANAFRQVLARDPDNAAANERLGLVLLGQRDNAQAKSHLDRALALDDSRWKTVNALGVIADLEGEHTQAAAYFRQALTLEPRSAKILTNLGYSLYLADDWDQAEQMLLQALDEVPDYELALRNLALLHSRRGNDSHALQLLLQVTGEAQAHNDVGYLCLLEGRHAVAANYFNRAIELSPSYYELAHRNLERAQKKLRQHPATPDPAPIASRQAHARPPAPAAPAAAPAPEPATAAAARTPEPATAATARTPVPATAATARTPEPATAATARTPEPATAATARTALDSSLFADDADNGYRAASGENAAQSPAAALADATVRAEALQDAERPLYLKRWVKAGVLNVREDDSPNARLLDKLRRGRVVRVLREENGWAYVRYWEFVDDNIATREGWVHADYLSESRQRA